MDDGKKFNFNLKTITFRGKWFRKITDGAKNIFKQITT